MLIDFDSASLADRDAAIFGQFDVGRYAQAQEDVVGREGIGAVNMYRRLAITVQLYSLYFRTGQDSYVLFLQLRDELRLLLVALQVGHLFRQLLVLVVHVFDLGFIVVLLVLLDLISLFLQLLLEFLDVLLLLLAVVVELFQLFVLLLFQLLVLLLQLG